MPLYALGDQEPQIHPDAFVHPDAVLIGAVTIGSEASVWPTAVIRADEAPIEVGARTSVQDGTIVHTTRIHRTRIGADCVIGHNAHLEGCEIQDLSLVGSGSIVLHGAVVETGALVGAHAVITNGMRVPSGAMALGIPAKLREGVVDVEMIRLNTLTYIHRAKQYRTDMRRID